MTLLAAAQMGQLGLVKGTIVSTGEEVAVICVVFDEENEYKMIPLGHMCNDESPYTYYKPDTDSLIEVGMSI